MTDRIHSFQVILEEDIREDDLAGIVGAIRHVKGVLDVQPIVSTFDSQMAQTRARTDIKRRLVEVLTEV